MIACFGIEENSIKGGWVKGGKWGWLGWGEWPGENGDNCKKEKRKQYKWPLL